MLSEKQEISKIVLLKSKLNIKYDIDGNPNFKIFKEDSANATTTKIEELKDSERVEELAMMLGGKNIGESARAHARALLD